eukprot:6196756-Pleurochrysis_carterae.AAC.4
MMSVYRPGGLGSDYLYRIPTITGKGAGAGAGAGRNYGAAQGKGSSRAAAAIASKDVQELGERSASAPAVHMRRESKTGNCACECQIEARGVHDNSCK